MAFYHKDASHMSSFPPAPPQALQHLESLLLEGNPVTSEVGYRAYVVGTLGRTLTTLDKVPVAPEERKVRAVWRTRP
jgi:hypothetical protein